MSSPVPTTVLAGVPALGVAPDGSLYVAPAAAAGFATAVGTAESVNGLTWQLTATNTKAALATVWAATTAYTVGQVVKNGENIYRCTLAGTSGSTGPTGVGHGIEDGTVVWKGAGPFTNGFFVTNAASSTGGQTVYWGFSDLTATTGDAIAPGGQGRSIRIADPTLIWVMTASSTASVTVSGLSTDNGGTEPLSSLLVVPPDFYATVGLSQTVYFDGLADLPTPTVTVDTPIGTTTSTSWTFTPSSGDVGDHLIKFTDQAGGIAFSHLHVSAANAGDAATIALLFCGDSLTAATDSYIEEVGTLLGGPTEPTWSMVGTQVTGGAPAGVRHEGYGGQTFNWFLTDPNSPFIYDDVNRILDIPQYIGINGTPSIVCLNLGINDNFTVDPNSDSAINTSVDGMCDRANTLINAFKAAIPTVKIAVWMVPQPNARDSAFTANYGGQYTRQGWMKIRKRLHRRVIERLGNRKSENIWIVPVSVHSLDGFPEDNALHPNASGYSEIGRFVYSWIKSIL